MNSQAKQFNQRLAATLYNILKIRFIRRNSCCWNDLSFYIHYLDVKVCVKNIAVFSTTNFKPFKTHPAGVRLEKEFWRNYSAKPKDKNLCAVFFTNNTKSIYYELDAAINTREKLQSDKNVLFCCLFRIRVRALKKTSVKDKIGLGLFYCSKQQLLRLCSKWARIGMFFSILGSFGTFDV